MIHCTYVIISACFRQHLDLSSSSSAKLFIVSKCSSLPRIMGIPWKNKFYKCMFHSPIEALSKDAISSGMVPSSPTEQIMVGLFRIQIIENVLAHVTGSQSVKWVHFLYTSAFNFVNFMKGSRKFVHLLIFCINTFAAHVFLCSLK